VLAVCERPQPGGPRRRGCGLEDAPDDKLLQHKRNDQRRPPSARAPWPIRSSTRPASSRVNYTFWAHRYVPIGPETAFVAKTDTVVVPMVATKFSAPSPVTSKLSALTVHRRTPLSP